MSRESWRRESYGKSPRQVSIELADTFAGRVPTVEELRRATGMSKAEAYRWRAAFALARPHLTPPSIAVNLAP